MFFRCTLFICLGQLLMSLTRSWAGCFMVVIFELFNTSLVLSDLFWDTSVSVLFKTSRSLVWVEISIETQSITSKNLISATLAPFNLHFRHLKNCSTFACFEKFLKCKVSFLWGQCIWDKSTYFTNCSWSTMYRFFFSWCL